MEPNPPAVDLEAYLDELLPGEEMARLEEQLRNSAALREQLAAANARRDSGIHSLGEIWRRERLTCPTREQLGSHLLQILPEEYGAYVAFHLDVIGCRFCQANLEDLKRRQAEPAAAVAARRKRYFESSAGHLKK